VIEEEYLPAAKLGANFIAHKNEELGSRGQVDAARANVEKG
jgi:hypothetical protein